MIPRAAKAKLLHLLQRFPAVALLGPRQAGKTTLPLSLEEQLKPQALYLDLELPTWCFRRLHQGNRGPEPRSRD
jgi:predicted AAA+ superfamily ATPase